MKILSVVETPNQQKNPKNMDLLTLTVEYNNGETGKAYLYRANVVLMMLKEKLLAKGISETEIDSFINAVKDSYEADHFYDNED